MFECFCYNWLIRKSIQDLCTNKKKRWSPQKSQKIEQARFSGFCRRRNRSWNCRTSSEIEFVMQMSFFVVTVGDWNILEPGMRNPSTDNRERLVKVVEFRSFFELLWWKNSQILLDGNQKWVGDRRESVPWLLSTKHFGAVHEETIEWNCEKSCVPVDEATSSFDFFSQKEHWEKTDSKF